MSFELPQIPQLPAFITATPRYEEEAARLQVAEIVLANATRQASNARNGHLDAAWSVLEKQVVVPFENLVSANASYVEDGNTSFLGEWEAEALPDYPMQARAWRKARQLPKWSEEEIADIMMLQRLFPEALKTEPLDDGDRSIKYVRGNVRLEESDYKDWGPVIEAALRDIANRGGQEG